MTGPLIPVGGDATSARALADLLDGQGAWVDALERVLRGLAGDGYTAWEGSGERAFAEAVARAGPVLRGVGRRYAVAALVVRRLADAVARAQVACAAAVRVHEQARDEVVALGEARVLAEAGGDPAALATVPRLTADLLDAGERVARAEGQHASAWEDYRQVDRACAAVLSTLCRDGLADSWRYDALGSTSRFAAGVATVVALPAAVPAPPLKVFDVVEAAAGGVAFAADAATWACYGDGDPGTIALAGVAGAAGPLSSVLKRGAVATNPAAATAATRAERRSLRPSTVERLRAGAIARGPAVKVRPSPPWTAPPRGATALRRWALDQAEARVTAGVRRRWLDELDVVTRTPGTSRPMLVTGFAVEATGAGAGGAARLVTAADARGEGERREAVQRRHDPGPGAG